MTQEMSRNQGQLIVGVDCATNDKRVGVAVGEIQGEEVVVWSACSGAGKLSALELVREAISQADRALLAVDAPLGWPSALGISLPTHRAGSFLAPEDAHKLFRRETDRCIKKHTDVQPLDVGADRIARTAHRALRLLRDLPQPTDGHVELAWTPDGAESPVRAIEVYPAATLHCCGLRHRAYKERDDRDRRREIMRGLQRNFLRVRCSTRGAVENADILDAIVCVLAGADFLLGNAIPPCDPSVAEKEGWIWCRRLPARSRRQGSST